MKKIPRLALFICVTLAILSYLFFTNRTLSHYDGSDVKSPNHLQNTNLEPNFRSNETVNCPKTNEVSNVDSTLQSTETNVLSSTGRLFQAKIKRTDASAEQWLLKEPTSNYKKHSDLNCKKWIVLTTVFEPSQVTKAFHQVTGWCFVIVGDNKTPANYLSLLSEQEVSNTQFVKNTVFLDVKTQKKLPYKISAALPWNHYSRKNVGYLYAIHHGAEVIYDTDDDNALLDTTYIPCSSFDFQHVESFAPNATPLALNLYPYFHPSNKLQPDLPIQAIWPRGFPLDSIVSSSSPSIPLSTANFNLSAPPSIIQLLQQHDPDMDAIFRLTHPLPIEFKSQPTRMITVPKGSYVPFNAQSTVWHMPAFWGLFLPATVSGRVSDIWRSYFVQKVLKDYNLTVAYTTPGVIQDRNVHSYLADFASEQDLYLKTTEMVKYLHDYQINKGKTSNKNVNIMQEWYNVLLEMYKIDAIQLKDLHFSQSWLEDLSRVNYKFETAVEAFIVRTSFSHDSNRTLGD